MGPWRRGKEEMGSRRVKITKSHPLGSTGDESAATRPIHQSGPQPRTPKAVRFIFGPQPVYSQIIPAPALYEECWYTVQTESSHYSTNFYAKDGRKNRLHSLQSKFHKTNKLRYPN